MKLDLDRLLPNRPEDADIELIELGDHRYPALVVDNFFRDPEHVREFAATLKYKIPPSLHPGYFAVASLSMAAVAAFTFEVYAKEFYASPEAMERHANSWQFFRVEQQKWDPPRPASRSPHADLGLLVGLVYLNKPEHCRGGTSFWRHTPTGTEELFPKEVVAGQSPDKVFTGNRPLDLSVRDRMWGRGARRPFDLARETGLAGTYAEYWKMIRDTPGDEHDNIVSSCGGWELTRVLEMKYNRLLLYPGFMLHSGHFRNDWFGNTPDSSRLTANFMFHWPTMIP